MKANNTYGAWLMDAIWTEMRCVLNVSREDVEYVAVPNEAYKAIPITWPPNLGARGLERREHGQHLGGLGGHTVAVPPEGGGTPYQETHLLRPQRMQ